MISRRPKPQPSPLDQVRRCHDVRRQRKALLDVVPEDGTGLTLDAIRERLPALLPEDLFPGAAKANWWAKTVQLDLEAKGVIVGDKSSPLRLRKA
jgi:hypothetical protein